MSKGFLNRVTSVYDKLFHDFHSIFAETDYIEQLERLNAVQSSLFHALEACLRDVTTGVSCGELTCSALVDFVVHIDNSQISFPSPPVELPSVESFLAGLASYGWVLRFYLDSVCKGVFDLPWNGTSQSCVELGTRLEEIFVFRCRDALRVWVQRVYEYYTSNRLESRSCSYFKEVFAYLEPTGETKADMLENRPDLEQCIRVVLSIMFRPTIREMFRILSETLLSLDADQTVTSPGLSPLVACDACAIAFEALLYVRKSMLNLHDLGHEAFFSLLTQFICPVTLEILYQSLLGIKRLSFGMSEPVKWWAYSWRMQRYTSCWWEKEVLACSAQASLWLEMVRLLLGLMYLVSPRYNAMGRPFRYNRIISTQLLTIVDDVESFLATNIRLHYSPERTSVSTHADPCYSLLFTKALFILMSMALVYFGRPSEASGFQMITDIADDVTMMLPFLVDGCTALVEDFMAVHMEQRVLQHFLDTTLVDQMGRILDLTYAVIKTKQWGSFVACITEVLEATPSEDQEDGTAWFWRYLERDVSDCYHCHFLELLFQAFRLLQFMALLVPPHLLSAEYFREYFTGAWIRSALAKRRWLALCVFEITKARLHLLMMRDSIALLQWGLLALEVVTLPSLDDPSEHGGQGQSAKTSSSSSSSSDIFVHRCSDYLWVFLLKRLLRFAVVFTLEHIRFVTGKLVEEDYQRARKWWFPERNNSGVTSTSPQPLSRSHASMPSCFDYGSGDLDDRRDVALEDCAFRPCTLPARRLSRDVPFFSPSIIRGIFPGSGGRLASWAQYSAFLDEPDERHFFVFNSAQSTPLPFQSQCSTSSDLGPSTDLTSFSNYLNSGFMTHIEVFHGATCACIESFVSEHSAPLFTQKTSALSSLNVSPSDRQTRFRGSRPSTQSDRGSDERFFSTGTALMYKKAFQRLINDKWFTPSFSFYSSHLYLPHFTFCQCFSWATAWIYKLYEFRSIFYREQVEGLSVCLMDLFCVSKRCCSRREAPPTAPLRHCVSCFAASITPDQIGVGLRNNVVVSLFQPRLCLLFSCAMRLWIPSFFNPTFENIPMPNAAGRDSEQLLRGASFDRAFSASLRRARSNAVFHRGDFAWMLKDALNSLDVMGGLFNAFCRNRDNQLITAVSSYLNIVGTDSALSYNADTGSLHCFQRKSEYQSESPPTQLPLRTDAEFHGGRSLVAKKFSERCSCVTYRRCPVSILVISEQLWPALTAALVYGDASLPWTDDRLGPQHPLLRHSVWLQHLLLPFMYNYHQRFPGKSLDFYCSSLVLEIVVTFSRQPFNLSLPELELRCGDTSVSKAGESLHAARGLRRVQTSPTQIFSMFSAYEPFAQVLRHEESSDGAGNLRYAFEDVDTSQRRFRCGTHKSSKAETSGALSPLRWASRCEDLRLHFSEHDRISSFDDSHPSRTEERAQSLTFQSSDVDVVVLAAFDLSVYEVLVLEAFFPPADRNTVMRQVLGLYPGKTFEEICSLIPSALGISCALLQNAVASLVKKTILLEMRDPLTDQTTYVHSTSRPGK